MTKGEISAWFLMASWCFFINAANGRRIWLTSALEYPEQRFFQIKSPGYGAQNRFKYLESEVAFAECSIDQRAA